MSKNRRKYKPATSILIVMWLMTVIAVVDSYASLNGRNGFSGNPSTNGGATCAVCHTSGATVPIVTLTGPTVVDAGTTNGYTVTITGGPAQTGGVNISVSDFVGQLAPSDLELHLIGNELSHVAPKSFVGNTVTFSFQWTAPAYNTTTTLYAAGNSSNGQLDLLSDGVNTHSLEVTVQNGTQPPPPEDNPPVGDIQLEEYVSGLISPVAVTHAGDSRLFVVERPGYIRIIEGNGNLLATPFLDIAGQVDSSSGEMGLLGLAFHPNYNTNGYFYVYYTRDPGTGLDRSRVARFQVSANPDVANPNSEVVIMEFEQPYANHNGGDLHFGPDGFLYVASGDGGSGGDPQNFGQRSDTLLGKLLRIDVDAKPSGIDGPDCEISGNANYRIPPSNAFSDGPGGQGCDEIYASGLRNPWRFSFDKQTGDLWIADVGQNNFEEINFVLSGAAGGLNFGWRCYEGNNGFNLSGCTSEYFSPVHTFSHADGNCSVTGGFVYRGSINPAFEGHYFFTDFCNTAIRTLSGPPGERTLSQVLPAGEISTPSSFGEDVNGELYITSLNGGRLYKVNGPLAVTLDADKTSPALLASVGTVQWTATASGGSGSSEYQFWLRDPSGPWAMVQAYGPDNTFDWTPPSAGNWLVAVRARNQGSPAALEADTARSFQVINEAPVTSVSLSANKTSPAPLATVGTVQWTATASGGSGSSEYQFWLRGPSGPWAMVQAYGPDNTFDWTPPSAGNWLVAVRARNQGSPAALEADTARFFQVINEAPVTSVSLSANKTSPAPLATVGTVQWTATASGGSGSSEYQFWLRDPSGPWAMVQAYGPDNTFDWTPPSAGNWLVAVRARNQGSPAVLEADTARFFQVINEAPVTPVTSVSLSANKTSPASLATVGTVQWTATASGGSGSSEYQFWLRDPSGPWAMVQAYGPDNTFDWTPPSAGNWLVAVRARNQGSPAVLEADTASWFEIISP